MKMKSLLWTALAFLCTAFDIPVAGVDILPDILGYFLLFICFSVLTVHEGSFNTPRLFSALLFLSQLVFLLKLVDNQDILLLLQVAVALTDLLLFFFAFSSLRRLAVSFEQDDLRLPADSAFFFYAPTAVLPLLSDLAPDIEKLCLFVAVCLYLYVFNVIIRCYRQILLPVEEPEVLERSSADDLEDSSEAEPGILPDAPPDNTAAEEVSPALHLPDFDE